MTVRIPLLLFLLALATPDSASGQRYVKVNGLSALVGVPGVAYERVLRERVSFQFDATISPWRSVDGVPMQFAMLVPEWRYHPRGAGQGPYVGAHLGGSWFRLQKWDHRGSDRYQEGFGLLIGGTAGYQWALGDRLGLDLYVGGGSSQALYKGYHRLTGARYDSANGWNRSGEWIPYRGGLMLRYRLGARGGA